MAFLFEHYHIYLTHYLQPHMIQSGYMRLYWPLQKMDKLLLLSTIIWT